MNPSIDFEAVRGARVSALGQGGGGDGSWSGAQGGEEGFVERFGARLERMVAGALWRLRLSPAEVGPEDLLQDVYCRVFERGLKTFDGMAEGQVVLYLKRIVRTTLVSRLRSDKALKRGGTWLRDRAPVWQLTDPELSPEGELLHREARDHLLWGCQWLAAQGQRDGRRDALVIALILAGGWTSREVSAASEGRLSFSSIDSLLWRSRQKLDEKAPALRCEASSSELPATAHAILRRAMSRRSRSSRNVC